MFKLFRREPKEKSCTNCAHFDKKEVRCKATKNSTLKSFPFKNTKCKTYRQK